MNSEKRERTNKRMKGKRSFYYKFFISFLVILLIPMLTIGLLFMQARTTVKEQIVLSSENSLEQFFQHIDSVFSVEKASCINVAYNAAMQKYMEGLETDTPSKLDAYKAFMASGILKEEGGSINKDLVVYHPGLDYIISTTHSNMQLDSYFAGYYAAAGQQLGEEFRELVENAERRPMLHSINGKGTDSYLCITMRGGSSKSGEFVVVSILSRNDVQELLLGMNTSYNGVSMILDQDRELLLATDDEVQKHLIRLQPRVTGEYELDGTKYMIQSQASQALDIYYAYAVPYHYFWSRLYRLYLIFILGVSASVALGVFVAYRQTKRVYQPIGEMMSRIQEKGVVSWDPDANTEFEFLQTLFGKAAEERIALNAALRRGEDIKRSNFILSLLVGNAKTSATDDDIFKKNGITLCSDYFRVAVLQAESVSDLDEETIHFVVSNVLLELCDREYQGYMVHLSEGRFALLVNLNGGTDEGSLHALLEEGMAFLNRYYELSFTIGVSSVQEGMLGVHEAFQQAILAIRYSYLLGKEIIIDHSQIAEREFKSVQVSEMKMLHSVLDWLAGDRGDELSAHRLVKECALDYHIDREASLEMVECFKFETVSMFSRILQQEGNWTEDWKRDIMDLIGKSTFAEFTDQFAELLLRMRRKKQESAGEENVCSRAMEYIEANYADNQLTLTQLGDMLEMTPSYLSKLFKDKYQLSIPDYIAKTRVSHAKKQLRETECSIQEIAQDNGFLNSNSFIRVFKKQEGITPGVYRSLADDQASGAEECSTEQDAEVL